MNILKDYLLMQFFYIQNRKIYLNKKILYKYFVFLSCSGQLQIYKLFYELQKLLNILIFFQEKVSSDVRPEIHLV